jgi:hypothetical protein
MKLRERILWILLSVVFFLCPFLSFAGQKERTIYVVWDEFVKVSNSGADHATNVQDYFKACIEHKVSPETFYSVKAINELTEAAREFRESADKLDELRRRIENPIPKGTITARR